MLWPHAMCCSCAWQRLHNRLRVVQATGHLSLARQQPLEHKSVEASVAMQLVQKSLAPHTDVMGKAAALHRCAEAFTEEQFKFLCCRSCSGPWHWSRPQTTQPALGRGGSPRRLVQSAATASCAAFPKLSAAADGSKYYSKVRSCCWHWKQMHTFCIRCHNGSGSVGHWLHLDVSPLACLV